MRPKGSAEALRARRQKAVALLSQGISLREIARRIGCNASSVMRWRDKWNALGEEGLEVLTSTGRPAKLNTRQKTQLLGFLRQGPKAFGLNSDAWTLKRVTTLIQRKFSVDYHFTHVGRLLHSLGWRPLKSEPLDSGRTKAPRGWAPG